MKSISKMLTAVPPVILILIIVILAFFLTGKRIWMPIFTIVGLWLIHNQGYWDHLINTFTLVLISSLLSVVIGVPIGILMSKSRFAEAVITPDRKSTRLNSSHVAISYAVFCLKKKNKQ